MPLSSVRTAWGPIASSRRDAADDVMGSRSWRSCAFHPLQLLGGVFLDRDRPNDPDVAGDVVLVARMHGELDELVGFGLGNALLDAVLEDVEALVDRFADLR